MCSTEKIREMEKWREDNEIKVAQKINGEEHIEWKWKVEKGFGH